MKEIVIAKATRTFEDQVIEDTIIHIKTEIPSFEGIGSLIRVEYFYLEQAEILADALLNSLPQGTADRLLYKLMGKKASLYQGPTGK